MYIVNDTLLPKDIVDRLDLKYRSAKYKFFWASNQFAKHPFFHWHIDILESTSDNTDDLSSQLYAKSDIYDEITVWELLQKELLGPSDLLRCYANAYTFGTEGLPHTDSYRNHERTVIIYLNSWKPQWGGETIVFEGDNVEKSVIPKLGRIFIFPSNKLHVASPVSKHYTGLRKILVFKTRSKEAPTIIEDTPELKEFLKNIGTDKILHGNQTLYRHLVFTYELLKEWKVAKHVCLAGLFHSIYGTVFYQHDLKVEREKIQELIGKEAEYLVWLFCNLNHKKINLEFFCYDPKIDSIELPLKTDYITITITQKTLEELALLAKANRRANV